MLYYIGLALGYLLIFVLALLANTIVEIIQYEDFFKDDQVTMLASIGINGGNGSITVNNGDNHRQISP